MIIAGSFGGKDMNIERAIELNALLRRHSAFLLDELWEGRFTS